MKLLLTNVRFSRAGNRPDGSRSVAQVEPGDDALGKGMELALTVAIFLVGGVLLDRWLGTSPLFTVALLAVGAVGTFVQMRYAYEERMQRLEAERRQLSVGAAARVDGAA